MCYRAKTKHDDDDYKVANLVGGEEANYYMQAHSVRENVTAQASIMVNGTLKEYQVRNLHEIQNKKELIWKPKECK